MTTASMRGTSKPIHVGQFEGTGGGTVSGITQGTTGVTYIAKLIRDGFTHLWKYDEAAGDAIDSFAGETGTVVVTGGSGANPTRQAAKIPSIPAAAGYVIRRSDTYGRVKIHLADDGAGLVSGNGDWSYVWWHGWSDPFLGAETVLQYGNVRSVLIEVGSVFGHGHDGTTIFAGGDGTWTPNFIDIDPYPSFPLGIKDDGKLHMWGVSYEGATKELSVYFDGAYKGKMVHDVNLNIDLPSSSGNALILDANVTETFKIAMAAYASVHLTAAQMADLSLGDGSAAPGATTLPLHLDLGSSGNGWIENDFATGAIKVIKDGMYSVTVNGSVGGIAGESYEVWISGTDLHIHGTIGPTGVSQFSGAIQGHFVPGQLIGPALFTNLGTHGMDPSITASVVLVGPWTDPNAGGGSTAPPTPPAGTGTTVTVTTSTTVAQFLAYVADMSVATIQFASGFYPWRTVRITTDRTTNPLMIEPVPGASVVFSGATVPTIEGVFFFGDASGSNVAKYITMQGFTFQNYALSACGVFEVRQTFHVSLLNMTFRGLTRDPAYGTPSQPFKCWCAYISDKDSFGGAGNDYLTIDNWIIIGGGRNVHSGIQLDRATTASAHITVSNIKIKDCDYAFYENVPGTTFLTLDGWDVTNCGEAGKSIIFHRASGIFQNMTGHPPVDPIMVVDASTMVRGANVTGGL